jgi:hypothetical protein
LLVLRDEGLDRLDDSLGPGRSSEDDSGFGPSSSVNPVAKLGQLLLQCLEALEDPSAGFGIGVGGEAALDGEESVGGDLAAAVEEEGRDEGDAKEEMRREGRGEGGGARKVADGGIPLASEQVAFGAEEAKLFAVGSNGDGRRGRSEAGVELGRLGRESFAGGDELLLGVEDLLAL